MDSESSIRRMIPFILAISKTEKLKEMELLFSQMAPFTKGTFKRTKLREMDNTYQSN